VRQVHNALVLATHNRGKSLDLASLFENCDIQLSFAYEMNVPEPVETGMSFAENALLKARHTVGFLGLPALADDCGLCISSLNGEPGIHSKRYALSEGSWEGAIQRIIQRIEGKSNIGFMCCSLALVWPDGSEVCVTGRLEGKIVYPRGQFGFGFDPCFQPTRSAQTLGEMTTLFRNKNNHRELAFSMLSEKINWQKLQLIR
jgi:XTP/dITP diphosphohydrolase